MTEVFECPKDGCDYSGLKTSVAAHYSGSKDHSGGYEKATMMLDEAGATKSVDTQIDDEADEARNEGQTTDPVKETPETYVAPQESDQSDEAESGCPQCGGTDWFDASEAGYDRGCPECSDPENWVVWHE